MNLNSRPPQASNRHKNYNTCILELKYTGGVISLARFFSDMGPFLTK